MIGEIERDREEHKMDDVKRRKRKGHQHSLLYLEYYS